MAIVEVNIYDLLMNQLYTILLKNSLLDVSIHATKLYLGPLTYNDGGRATVVGVVSWGSRSCFGPGVFARVTEVLPWVQEQMRQPCQD